MNFYDNDGRLGPQRMLAPLLQGYSRLGGLSSHAFFAKWWDDKGWKWPEAEHDGFVMAGDKPLSAVTEIPAGTWLDRFGKEDTQYFAPFGTPYRMRSLPPSSLNDPYHIYVVLKPFKATTGPIAPGFEQAGLGTQYKVFDYKDPAEMVKSGCLKRLNDAEVDEALSRL